MGMKEFLPESGEEGGKYRIFTGKYGNMNFKIKITLTGGGTCMMKEQG